MRDVDLNDLRVFARVVERGGFAAAARELRVPTSTVSRAVARLEASLGTRLLQRTPRSVHATREGRAIYVGIELPLGTLELVARAFEPPTRQPRGVLRVAAPNEIGSAFLAQVVVAYRERFPQVQVEVALSNRAVNLVEEGFDVAIRAAPRLGDSSLVAKKIGELHHALYASPAYLARRGFPASPRELADHACLLFRAKDLAKTWRLSDGDETAEVPIRGALGGDDFSYLRATALAGGGIALLPELLCAEDAAAGRLVRVLPKFRAAGAGLFVIYPSSRQLPARVTAFREAVAAGFRAWSAAHA